MTAVPNLSSTVSPYVSPPFFERSCKEIICDIALFILFPLGGLARLAGSLIGKYIVPLVLLPSASDPPPPEVPLKTGAEAITIPTPDGEKLDSLVITNEGATKWIVFANPNGEVWQGLYSPYNHPLFPNCIAPPYFQSALDAGYNVLCVNYRGTGNSTGHAENFDNLFCDIDSGIQYLIREKRITDPAKEIIMHGHSLGGASALEIGQRYRMKVIVQNTFSSPCAVASAWVNEGLFSSLRRQTTENATESSSLHTALWSLKDTLFSLPHMAIRITTLFFLILGHLMQGELKEAGNAVLEIGKTILLDTILTITGLVSLLISPFTNKLNHFNGNLNAHFIDSSAILSLAHFILKHTHWNPDNKKAAEELGDRLFISYAEYDEVIPKCSALTEHPTKNPENITGQNFCHFDILPLTDRRIQLFLQESTQ